MNETDKKFYEKNADVFKQLDTLIENNRDSIRCIISSPETMYRLGHSDKGEVISEEHRLMRYNDIRIVEDVYYPVPKIQIVWKDTTNVYKFNTPSISGVFEDEKNDFDLK